MSYLYIPGTPNWNAASKGGEHLTIDLDFYTVTTGVNILVAAPTVPGDVANLTPEQAGGSAYGTAGEFVAGTIPNDFSQDALDRLVEIVSQRGQPVIMGNPTGPVANAYTFKFAIEHGTAWGVTATTSPVAVPALVASIQAAGKDFGFDTDSALAVTVAKF